MTETSLRQETTLRRIVPSMAGVTFIGSDGSISPEWDALVEAADDGDEVGTVRLEPAEAPVGIGAGSRQYRVTVYEVTDETYKRAREAGPAAIDALQGRYGDCYLILAVYLDDFELAVAETLEQAEAVVDAHPDVREIDREDENDFGEDEDDGSAG